MEEQQSTIIDLKGAVEKQQKQIKALSEGLQKVSAARGVGQGAGDATGGLSLTMF